MAGTVAPTIPTIGDPNSTEDADIRSSLITLRDALNAVLTSSNILDGAQLANGTVPLAALASAVTTAGGDLTGTYPNPTIGAGKVTNATIAPSAGIPDSKLASPTNSVYKTLLTASGRFDSSPTSATYLLGSVRVTGGGTADNPLISGTAYSYTVVLAPPSIIYFDDADYTVGSLTQKLRVRAQIASDAVASGANFTFGLYPVSVAGAGSNITYTAGAVVSGSTVALNAPSASTITQGNSGDFTVPADGAYLLAVALSGWTGATNVTSVHATLQTRNV